MTAAQRDRVERGGHGQPAALLSGRWRYINRRYREQRAVLLHEALHAAYRADRLGRRVVEVLLPPPAAADPRRSYGADRHVLLHGQIVCAGIVAADFLDHRDHQVLAVDANGPPVARCGRNAKGRGRLNYGHRYLRVARAWRGGQGTRLVAVTG